MPTKSARSASAREGPAAAHADAAGLLECARACGALFPHAVRRRPDFRIDRVVLADGATVPVQETALDAAPFCTLLHFRKPGPPQPRVLIAAPMSGHYASGLRDTVLTMLPEHDVYLTDWQDARQVPLAAGAFRIEDYTACLMRFLARIGPGAHLLAICQSCVPALSAAALMAEEDDDARPASLALFGGPVDASRNPTAVGRYATGAPLDWFERNLISIAPASSPGAGRRVYAAELQLLSTLGMHWQRSIDACRSAWLHPFGVPQASMELWRMLADAQFAVQDLDAEFYLDNLRLVFREQALARGRLRCFGRAVRPACLRDTALMTVEAEFDDICAPGQTAAAHALCSGLPAALRRRHLLSGAGHRNLFTGALWRSHVYPWLKSLIHDTAPTLQRGNP
jgi:polyhydroxyalkanoate depolymerase